MLSQDKAKILIQLTRSLEEEVKQIDKAVEMNDKEKLEISKKRALIFQEKIKEIL